ncbi:MAG TPA: GDYXXLXY domain-containing protein, partial [Dehalococcoidia bacterium]|nr:GDYXXLXY domain-containing protein [Dehalococcoidia bacterium]
MSLKFNVAFWGIVAAQLVLLLAMVGFKEYTLRTGTVVTLQTVPVDPRSILQGDYAILQYRIATLPPYMQD